MRTFFWLVLFLHGSILFASADMSVKKCSSAPKLDGVLEDPCWRDSNEIHEFYLLGQKRKSSLHRVRFCADQEYLYVAFEVFQDASRRLPPVYDREHDSSVQRDDCVKISFAPAGSGQTWYHFKLNRANIRQERRYTAGTKCELESWNIPWRSATREYPDRWTAEIALPICLLPPFDQMGQAKINFLITTNLVEYDAQGVVVKHPERVFFSAAGLEKDFTEPERFIPLRGLESLPLRAPFLPYLQSVSILPYFAGAKQFYYGIRYSLNPYSFSGGTVRIRVFDRAGDHAPAAEKRIELAPGWEETTGQIDVPVRNFALRTPKVILENERDGEILQSVSFAERETRRLDVLKCLLDKNYYTDESYALLEYRLHLPEESYKGWKLSVWHGKTTLITADFTASSGRLQIPIQKLPLGKSLLNLEIHDGKNVFSNVILDLSKRPSRPGFEYKIDQINQVLLDNGKAFFPFGIVAQCHASLEKSGMDHYASLGFNTALIWREAGIDTPQMIRYIQSAESAGLKVIAALELRHVTRLETIEKHLGKEAADQIQPSSLVFMKSAVAVNPLISRLPREIKNQIYAEYFYKVLPLHLKQLDEIRKFPSVICWFILDEPHHSFDLYQCGKIFSQKIHEMDGYRPVMVNYSSIIPAGEEWSNWMDILATDPYWVRWLPKQGGPEYVSKIVSRTLARAAARRQPIFIIPMAGSWSATLKRPISGAEQMAQTYLAAINGAKGILYYGDFTIAEQKLADSFSVLGKQFRLLGAACVLPEPRQRITYRNNGVPVICNPSEEQYVDVQFSLKKSPLGGYLLMAASCRPYPVTVSVTLRHRSGEVRDCFSNKKYALSGDVLTDVFEPYATRAYAIADFTDTAEIEVRMRSEKTPPEAIYLSGYRPGRKNEACNPSFEESDIPGWPNYYLTVLSGRPSGGYVGTENSFWGQDPTQAKFGKYSLKLKTPCASNNQRGFVMWRRQPQNPLPENYVFSIWAKADRPDSKISIRIAGFRPETRQFAIGTQWQRIHFNGILPANMGGYPISQITLETDGTVYLDGLQMEKGDVPTAFEE